MPYHNIVFVTLEKRLFNDHRWYMMSEPAQLNFVRLILFAAETYNKIPKSLQAIKKAFKTEQDLETIKKTIQEIKKNYPKFMENKHFYYFDEFETKTNYIPKREIPSVSQVLPKVGTDKEEDKEEDKERVIAFFAYFLLKTKRSFRLTDSNRELIKKRFGEGYTLEQLRQAVDNFILDDWPERKNRLDLIYCIGHQKGKPDALEKWLNFKPTPQFIKP